MPVYEKPFGLAPRGGTAEVLVVGRVRASSFDLVAGNHSAADVKRRG